MAKSISSKPVEVNLTAGKSKRELIRAKRREQKRRRTMTFVLITISALVILGVAVILPKFLVGKTKYTNTNGFSVGDPDAPVSVVEFSSYSCSYCKSFSEEYESDFIQEYVDSGNVYYTYVDIPPESELYLNAAEASYCAANQNRFFEYKELLFAYAEYSDAYTMDNLVYYATTAGLDTDEFQICMDSDIYAEAYLDAYEYAEIVGMSGTPSFLVNGTLVYSNELITAVEAYLGN